MLLLYVYAIVEASEFDTLLPGQSRSQYRFNKDRTKFVYKTFKEEPRLIGYSLYDKDQIKKILATNDWKSNLNI